MRRARDGIGRGMPGDDERIELADERERRPGAPPARDVRAHAGEREPSAAQTEPTQRLLDELGRSSLP